MSYNTNSNRFRAVGFDYDGVVKGRPGTVLREDIATLAGVSIDELNTAYFRNNTLVNQGKETRSQMWTRILLELQAPQLLNQVVEMEEAFVDNQTINHDVLAVAAELRVAGYKVGILSNYSHEAAEHMRNEEKLGRFFDVIHVSEETGFVKPDPDAFRHLATALDATTNQLVFTDDTARSLARADEAGFTPILFTDASQLRYALNDLGVEF